MQNQRFVWAQCSFVGFLGSQKTSWWRRGKHEFEERMGNICIFLIEKRIYLQNICVSFMMVFI